MNYKSLFVLLPFLCLLSCEPFPSEGGDGNGGRFSGKVLNAIRQAKPGDQYVFTNVKVKCPSDKVDRRVNGLAFHIR